MASDPPKVLISYSQDSLEHKDRVLVLSSTSARTVSICTIGQYVVMPTEGWPYAPGRGRGFKKTFRHPKSNCPRPLFYGRLIATNLACAEIEQFQRQYDNLTDITRISISDLLREQKACRVTSRFASDAYGFLICWRTSSFKTPTRFTVSFSCSGDTPRSFDFFATSSSSRMFILSLSLYSVVFGSSDITFIRLASLGRP
jgi:hypothetical protein